MTEWYFKPKSPGDTIREPVHGEFFASDAISDPGRALVREGIQNSLDAALKKGETVLVRIFLSGNDNTIPQEEIKPWLGGISKHIFADENGLYPEDSELINRNCRYLLFEDFETVGLKGLVDEAFKPRAGRKNNFYHFWRAEGQSDKDESDRGSWGVGKHVFMRASRISTLLGITVRADDNEHLLMGKTVLKSHYVGDDYYQDGYFGIQPEKKGSLVLPLTE